MSQVIPQQELQDLMRAAAKDAVQYVNEAHQVALDNSLNSLTQIDSILAELHTREQQQKHASEVVFTLCNIIAAYIGELYIASVGGEWRQNTSDSGAPFIYVKYNDKEFPFASICYHKICHDNSISLNNYMKQAMANAMQ
ncbi:hypothetical protein [Rheinheimera maricola]|uniref:DUF3806 domain-containing protein n=1 Tax=Rheinheimera maricola TaxID=2793282 RepID=A0ABS7XD87_9GAMM|nr:hypothetical protein [Rheinheimera maricola]MBZ9612732.1 hypothetical protein [Rheinheimera maricola]